MKYIKKFSIFFLLIVAFNSFGQTQKADEFYFSPIYGNHNVTITSSNEKFIDTKLTSAIDEVHNKGGGIITIKNGNYNFKKGVLLKSNVHIHVEPSVNFYMDNDGDIFTAGSKTTGRPISNFSIIGLHSDTGKQFTVHFKYGNTETSNPKKGFIRIGYATNFKLSNIKIIDAYTKGASVVLSGEFSTVNVFAGPEIEKTKKNGKKKIKKNKKNSRSSLITEVFGVPSKGIIEKMHNENGAYGYGLVQMQAGNNIVYRDLSGTGGVTLRLESGLNIAQLFRPVGSEPIYTVDGVGLPLTIDKQPKINQVYGTNIYCENGHGGFMMSPHTIKQGSVFLSKIRTKSCEAGGGISGGFINNFKREENAGLEVSKFGIVPGSFASNSVVSDVIADFGQYAQVKSKNFRYIPCDLRVDRGKYEKNVGLSITKGLDFESHRGPSLFPLHYASAAKKIGEGGYRINLDESTIIGNGFGKDIKKISLKESFACDESSDFSTVIGGKKNKKKTKKK